MRWRFERFSAGDRIPTVEVPHDCVELVIVGNQREIMAALLILLSGADLMRGLSAATADAVVVAAKSLVARVEETDRWIRERRDG